MTEDLENTNEKSRSRKVWELFITYASSMLFAFTGGNMTWPLIQQKLCIKYKLMETDAALEYFALGQSIPGALSLNTALLIGRSVAGWPGALAAAAGAVLPAFFGMLLIAFSYTVVSRISWITSAINGIRAASVGIIFCNAVMIAGTARGLIDVCLIAFALFATLVLGWGVIPVVLLCGALGVLRVWIGTKRRKPDGGKQA